MATSLAALAAASASTARSPFSTKKKLEKSTPPSASPMGGIKTSLTSELTMPVKDAPMITPTAKSTTLPRMANFLNSSNICFDPGLNAGGRLIRASHANKRQAQEKSRGRQPGESADAVGGKIQPFR